MVEKEHWYLQNNLKTTEHFKRSATTDEVARLTVGNADPNILIHEVLIGATLQSCIYPLCLTSALLYPPPPS